VVALSRPYISFPTVLSFANKAELEPDFEVAGTASDGEAALALVERLYEQSTPPDVILMDIRMTRMDGIAATRKLP
jgi:DNA-binding NarL/FixJ family response regulator